MAKDNEDSTMISPSLIKNQIVQALSHPEAEDGLYFNNLIVVHEEEERPIVQGEEGEVRKVLENLILEGVVESSGTGESAIFRLK
jgi:hypothetical protein